MMLLVFWLLMGIAPVWADETIRVDFSQTLGPVTRKGAGMGGTQQSEPVPASLTIPLGISNFRTDAPPCDEVPYNYAYWVTNEQVKLFSVEIGRCFISSSPPNTFPCDNNDCSTWVTFVTNAFNTNQSNGTPNVVYEFFNEPDNSWPRTQTQLFTAWKSMVTTLRALDANVKTVGPTYSFYATTNIHQFLDFAKANDCSGAGSHCYPTYLTWHELVNLAATVPPHIADARAYMASIGAPDLSININEYLPQAYHLYPGAAVKYFAVFENSITVVAGDRTCWDDPSSGGTLNNCFNASLLGLLIPGGTLQTRSNYWAYKAYGDMSGLEATVCNTIQNPTCAASVGVTGVDGVASRDTGQAVIVLGRDDSGGAENVVVTLNAVTTVPGFSGLNNVHVVARYIPNSAQNALTAPTTVLNSNVAIVSNNATVSLPGFGGLDAYELIVTAPTGVPPAAPFNLTVQ